MGKRHQDGPLGIPNPEFALQTPNDIFRFCTLTSSKEFSDDRRLFLLGL